ncbi:MAG: hypothetical protein ACREM3_25565, partial [Candidatus Rokuibacteriota bacterium]
MAREKTPSRASRAGGVGAGRPGGAERAARGRRGRVRRSYPQVDPGAAGLVDVGIITVPPSATVGEALRRARSREAGVVAAGESWVLRDDLARAGHLGLDDLPAEMVSRPLPVIDARVPEVSVRRRLAAGAPFVVVRDHRGLVGAVAPAPASTEGPSLGAWFTARLPAAAREALGAAA